MPTDITTSQPNADPPRPSVRVHLYTASEEDSSKKGVLKLSALLRPIHSTPLTSRSLILSLAKAPFELLLTAPRILFVAWKLHYQKRLDVFLRPEPLPVTQNLDGIYQPQCENSPGGVKWLEEGSLEYYARNKVEMFLKTRVQQTGIEVTILAPDPGVPPLVFLPDRAASPLRLTISYLSPRIFSILLLSPSAEHALLLGWESEKIFKVSSKELFIAVFSPRTSSTTNSNLTWLQRLRCAKVPLSLGIEIPNSHFLDENDGLRSRIKSGSVILSHRFLDWFEEWVFTIAHARVVEGQEPWMQWDRATNIYVNGYASVPAHVKSRNTSGSVIRESQ